MSEEGRDNTNGPMSPSRELGTKRADQRNVERDSSDFREGRLDKDMALDRADIQQDKREIRQDRRDLMRDYSQHRDDVRELRADVRAGVPQESVKTAPQSGATTARS
jgi:hypothetical protein